MLHASTNANGKRKMASAAAISAIMTTIRLRVDRVGVVMRPFYLSIRISPLWSWTILKVSGQSERHL